MGSKERNSMLGQGRDRQGVQSEGMDVVMSGVWVGVGLRVKDASVKGGSCRPHSPSSHPDQSSYSPSARPAGKAGGSTWRTAAG